MSRVERIITTKKTPGVRFRQARELLGLKQNECAERLGLEWYTLRDIESGKKKITPEMAINIEDLFSINFRWLLTGEGSMFLEGKKEDDDLDQLAREIIGEDLYAARVMMSRIPKEKLTDDKVDEIVKLLVGLDEQGIEAVLAAARQADRIVQLEKKHAG